MTLEGEKKTTR